MSTSNTVTECLTSDIFSMLLSGDSDCIVEESVNSDCDCQLYV